MADSLERQVFKLTQRLKKIAEQDVAQAASSALNKSAKRVETRIVSGVAKAENIPNKHIRKRVYIRKSSLRTQKAIVKLYRGDVPVISLLSKGVIANKMGTGTSRTGVTARGRKFPGAFIQTPGSGSPQVFRRQSAARYPLEAIKIPISKTINAIALPIAQRVMANDYQEIYRQELNYRLQKRLGKL